MNSLTAEERRLSYEEFKRKKVENQRIYRARLKEQQLALGIGPRKYNKRNEVDSKQIKRVAPPAPSADYKKRRKDMITNNLSDFIDNEKDFVEFPYFIDSPSISGQEETQSYSEVVLLCDEQERNQREVDDVPEIHVENSLEEEFQEQLIMEEVIETEDEECAVVVGKETDPEEQEITETERESEENEQPVMTEDEEQEAFYNKRDIILRLMDKLKKYERLQYLDVVEAMLRAGLSIKYK